MCNLADSQCRPAAYISARKPVLCLRLANMNTAQDRPGLQQNLSDPTLALHILSESSPERQRNQLFSLLISGQTCDNRIKYDPGAVHGHKGQPDANKGKLIARSLLPNTCLTMCVTMPHALGAALACASLHPVSCQHFCSKGVACPT